MGFGKLMRIDANDPREIARQLDAKKQALERLLAYTGSQRDETLGKQALTDLVKDATTMRLAAPMFELVPERARVLRAITEVDAARRDVSLTSTPATAPEDRTALQRAATARARQSVAELFVPRQAPEDRTGGDETRPVRDPTIELADFIAPERGSSSVSAVVIGNAEGTRTPAGGMKKAYGHHSDPGNRKPNRGSYSLQNATHLSPEEADREQQRRMKAVQPAYVAACKAAGIDPRNVVALVTYWDLYNIKPALATKFATQMPELARRGCTFEAALELRLRASKLVQGRSGWTGWENVARERLKRKSPQITDDEFWRVVRMVHGERQAAMQSALGALGIAKPNAAKQPAEAPKNVPRSAGLIHGSVGQGGGNAPADVEAVQQALVKHGHRVVVDRAIGPETIGAIRSFQGGFMHAPDGRVDAGKQTERMLAGPPRSQDPRATRPTEPALRTEGLRLRAGATGIVGGKTGPASGSTWNGTEAVADVAKRVAASMGITGTGKRSHTVGGKSSTKSDHHTSQRGAYAVDFGVLAKFGPRAKEVGTELAARIAQAYGIPPPYVGSYKKHYLLWNGIHVRIQILWRVAGHYDHVHFGVRRVK